MMEENLKSDVIEQWMIVWLPSQENITYVWLTCFNILAI